MIHLLLVHGNGGAETRFRLFLDWLRGRDGDAVAVHLPALPGFSGRPLPPAADGWAPFLEALAGEVAAHPDAGWVLYGHGIGGSLLLEWAAREWALPGGGRLSPRRVILHGSIGASLEHRFFPRLMRPRPVRRLVQWLVWQPMLQPLWERKLFLFPDRIPADLRRQFFLDYRRCAAFPVFFDLITPHWYREVRRRVGARPFYFLWGERERVVASRYLRYWQRDFPAATFEVAPEWDHFPMLDQPDAFGDKILKIALEAND